MLAKLSFMVPEPEEHQKNKPFAFQYYPHDPLPRQNYRHERLDIDVHDIRQLNKGPNFEREGFEIWKLESKLPAEEFYDQPRLKSIYAEEVREMLLKRLGASHVYFHECVIRKANAKVAGNPDEVVEGANAKHGFPIPYAHVDYTRNTVVEVVEALWKDKAEAILQRPFAAYNIWKPIYGPVRDWPLAVCDLESMDMRKELVATDSIFKDGVSEGYQVHYNPHQKWYFLSDHQPDELLVFRNADSEKPGGVAHCAFHDPSAEGVTIPRQSIELRSLVFF